MTIVYRRFRCPKCGFITEQKARAVAHPCPKNHNWQTEMKETPDDDDR